MKTKLQILQETADFYGQNPSKRGKSSIDGFCEYLTAEGNRCAVGRCSKLNKKLQSISGLFSDVLQIMTDKQFFKPEYQGHDPDFWRDLQIFHDGDSFWTKKGLSAKGRRKLQSLKKKYQ